MLQRRGFPGTVELDGPKGCSGSMEGWSASSHADDGSHAQDGRTEGRGVMTHGH